ncbi:TetR/AcrR family transcriptional regulator [Oceanobacillus neutriphilus]|uniref:TetR family transcriptional regulator n=1 Tax=Oceanobacillus neutriphilus TaxID=531815 RepID=A0ABQ2NRN8_9BACI|nr:TetR/AcrR family transcriptional regulator [Oceanobacillus neutriphilus]GGP08891.1 TetR family transcriptional regulator [Oceanobacillus neutriphilus]
MSNKTDRRIERTKRDFKNACLELIKDKKNIKSITVTDIVKLANYNRTTFYVHYIDKEDLLNDIMDNALNGFISSFRDPYKKGKSTLNIQHLTSNMIKIFDYVESNSSIFSLLFDSNLFPGFQQKLCYAIENVFKDEFEYTGQSFEDIDKYLYSRIEAYSLIGMLDFWIEQNFKYSSKYMTEQLLLQIHYSPSIIKIKNTRSYSMDN